MCGIAAIIGGLPQNHETIKKMINSINHRGPDHQGFFNDKKIQLGSCRLSIFDLSSKGNMPMNDTSKRFTIVFNGEIYNFKELKSKYDLKTNSNSDTEVLIELFNKFGTNCFKELNGIFAFIIYDKIHNKVYCVRDRLGIKPLFYTKKNNLFYFCSEIKGIKAVCHDITINNDIVEFYLKNSIYDFSNETFFKNIYQVKQSSYLEIDLNNNQFKTQKYWSLDSSQKKSDSEYLKNIFDKSLILQQLSDTKVGLNISNGIDSNVIISRLNRLNKGQKNILANSYFYSDDEFDHSKDIKLMSSYYNWKIDLREIKPSDIIENFSEVANYQDEPFPGISTISKHILIKNNYSEDCKVILEGQGGDDIAAGYKYYFPFFLLDKFKKNQFIYAFNEIKNFMKIEKMNLSNFFKFFSNSIKGYYRGGISADGTISNYDKIINVNQKEINRRYQNEILKFCKDKSYLKKIIYRDLIYTKLPRILRSIDRVSMAHSKEIRVPILDHNIVEYFYSLEPKDYINEGLMRSHYRKLFDNNSSEINKILIKKNYVPDPQTKWLKNQLYSWMYDKLSNSKFNLNGMIDKKKLINYMELFKSNKGINNSNFLWKLLNLEHIYQKYNAN